MMPINAWQDIVNELSGTIIVSCQAADDSPLNSPAMIAALAQSAARGQAGGLRINGPTNIVAVREVTGLPIIGINKIHREGYEVFITPLFQDAMVVIEAGADLVALDATNRPRPGGGNVAELVTRIHDECAVPVMADIATAVEGRAALEAGADLVATTLAGNTAYSPRREEPAFDIVEELATEGRVVVEGGVWTVGDVRRCFDVGAFAVVIGSAITVPEFITRRFVAAAGARAAI